MPKKKNRKTPERTNKNTAKRESRTTAKRKIRDSVFTNLFGEPKYSLQLYQVLHPEDQTMTQDAIHIVTLENMLMNRMYNDLGFKAGERLLILVESQSQWSENILVRILLYAAQTIQDDIAEKEENIYGSRKIALPEMEFYMIYVGEDRGEKPEHISLSESFYKGRETAIDLKVRVLYGENEGDIVWQYVRFSDICREQYRKYGRTKKAVEETIRICIEQRILEEYLKHRKKEVMETMNILYDQEYTWRVSMKEARNEALQRVVNNMAGKGYPPDEIAEAVDVDEETVKAWLNRSCKKETITK